MTGTVWRSVRALFLPVDDRQKDEKRDGNGGAYALGSLVSIGARGVAHVPVCNPNCLLTNASTALVYTLWRRNLRETVRLPRSLLVLMNQWIMRFIFLFFFLKFYPSIQYLLLLLYPVNFIETFLLCNQFIFLNKVF